MDRTKQETSIVSCKLTGKNQITVLESWDLTEGLQKEVEKGEYMRNRDLIPLIGRMASKQGWMKGDVVTNIAGNMFWALMLAGGHVDGH